MFDREITLNRFLLGYFDKVVADIPDDRIAERAPGGLHPPVWVLGHLAIVGEMGLMLLGGELQHPEWIERFGPQSSDEVEDADPHSKAEFVEVVRTAYPKLCEMLLDTPQERLDAPHGLELLEGTPIETVGDLSAHLLTTHFSFHLAQLSAWRRAAGNGPLL